MPQIMASSIGRIRRVHPQTKRIICYFGNLEALGYMWCKIEGRGYKVHRLIASAFIPNPKNLRCINHINCIKDDNRISNLEWCTHKQNTGHAWRNNKMPGRKGTANGRAKLTEQLVKVIYKLVTIHGMKRAVVAELFSVSEQMVYFISTRRNWRHVAVNT